MRHLMASPSVFLLLRSGDDWWDEVNNSVLWQDRIFHTLAVLYGLMFAVALVISSSLIFDCISGSRVSVLVSCYGFVESGIYLFFWRGILEKVGCDLSLDLKRNSTILWQVRSLIFVFRWRIDEIQPEVRLGSHLAFF
ncbi:hypothetical protein ZIOFF_065051 [Zingiber officinale]|uniref:THH1/TOM1/TOM3 domain-containing protein n=1 Tax=Zingiber officinale TaxID=94328 RepID=A0A8J5EWU8_ZINOF|nr:hypothetical protein ZIOFF_065051 [Zingiber officinale]